jgi:metallo-beta-lactamase class B
MAFRISLFAFLLVMAAGCKSQQKTYKRQTFKLQELSPNTYLHISYLETNTFGKVASNGIVVVDNKEALIIDTPVNGEVARDLIEWIENDLKCKPIGVIVTHAHEDCLGSLSTFHDLQIPSYAHNATIALARAEGRFDIPQNGFDDNLELTVGNKKVISEYFGEGHTRDNIVSYFPSEQVLFGGCLIKSKGAGKGNLADANVAEWPKTVRAVKRKYGDAAVVVPGHGKPGGPDLFDYTIKLFDDQ